VLNGAAGQGELNTNARIMRHALARSNRSAQTSQRQVRRHRIAQEHLFGLSYPLFLDRLQAVRDVPFDHLVQLVGYIAESGNGAFILFHDPVQLDGDGVERL
jgi:hypothetical protein